MMTSHVLLLVIMWVAHTYATPVINAGLCEMEIVPGIFDNKMVLGGSYIETNNAKYTFQTAEDCMQGCCDQSKNPALGQPSCNVAYIYRETDPLYTNGQQRNVCLWWNCKPGDCQSNEKVDQYTTSRIGRIISDGSDKVSVASVQPDINSQQLPAGYQPNSQYLGQQQYGNVQPSAPSGGDQYQPGNTMTDGQYLPNESIPAAQNTAEQGLINGQYQASPIGQTPNQGAPFNQYPNIGEQSGQYQDQGVPAEQYQGQYQSIGQYPVQSEAAQQQSPSGTLPAQAADTPGQWVFNPSTGQYVFTKPDVDVAAQDGAQQAPLQDAGSVSLDSNLYPAPQNLKNATENETKTANYSTTTASYWTTDSADKGWGFWDWWKGDDKDGDGDDDEDDDDDDKDWEDEWEEEEEKEEEEWEAELAEWDSEAENSTTPRTTDYPETTVSQAVKQEWGGEEEDDWEEEDEEEEEEEEEELEAWLNGQDTPDDLAAPDGEPPEPLNADVPVGATPQYYKPETFPSNNESSWAANAPIIAVGTCAGVVLMLLILILLGKKLTGTNDRAQYKPLRESFSGSSTYHEDI